MPLETRDYFNWCNQEITRYRNHEWQLAIYSSATLGFVIAWATDSRKSDVIFRFGRWLPAFIVGAAVLFFIMAEWHTRSRLRYYRDARTYILRYSGIAADPFRGLSRGLRWIDWAYAGAFYFFILTIGCLAVLSILAGGRPSPRRDCVAVQVAQGTVKHK